MSLHPVPALRVLLLLIVVVGCFMIAGAVSSAAGGVGGSSAAAPGNPADVATAMLRALLLLSGFVSLVVSYIVLRARASGWHLASALSVATFGLMTFLYYIETRVFLGAKMSTEQMNATLVMGGVFAALFAPLGVRVLGRWHDPRGPGHPRQRVPAAAWVWKLTVLGACYVVLYMAFGYFVAWQNPALRDYYAGTDPGSFAASLRQNWRATPWIFPLQFGRGILWALFLVPLVRAFRRGPGETGIAMGLFSAVWCLQLLLPNPYMPAEIRLSHLWETVGSNLAYGFCVGWLLTCPTVSAMNPLSPSTTAC